MSVNVINVNTVGSVVFENDVFTAGITPIAYGGTNASSYANPANGIVVYNGTSLINYSGPTITSDGYLKNNRQPAFFATSNINLNNISGDATAYTVSLNTASINHSASFNTSTSTFTAPVAGTFYFHGVFHRTNKGTCTSEIGYIECVRPSLGNINFNASSDMLNTIYSLQTTCLVTLDQGDTVTMVYTASGGTKNISLISSTSSLSTYFEGYYIA